MGKKLKKQRPVNLELTTIRFPVTAIASILHRISGVITFVALGILLWLLGLSLRSEVGFNQAADILGSWPVKCILWAILTALAYHIVGGIRHLLADFSVLDESLSAGINSAKMAFVITLFLSILAGILLW